MGKKVTLKIQVPEEQAEGLSIFYNKMAFEADQNDKAIMDLILAHNMDKTAEEIRWILASQHKINRSTTRIINMAKKIGVEIKK